MDRLEKLEVAVKAALAMRRLMKDAETVYLQVPREAVERFDEVIAALTDKNN